MINLFFYTFNDFFPSNLTQRERIMQVLLFTCGEFLFTFLFSSHLEPSPPLTSKSSAQQHLSHESCLTSEFRVTKRSHLIRHFLMPSHINAFASIHAACTFLGLKADGKRQSHLSGTPLWESCSVNGAALLMMTKKQVNGQSSSYWLPLFWARFHFLSQ